MVEIGKIRDKTLVLNGGYISIFRGGKLIWKKCYMPYTLPDGNIYWYRRRVRITELSGNTLTDYQIKIEIEAGDPIFAHARSAGEDIRFCYYPEAKMIPHWIEKYDPVAEEAIIWVKVPEIPANSEIEIYMYYGNPEVASASDGFAVFDFFDDFEDGDVSDWYNNECGIFEARTTTAFQGNYSIFIDDPADSCDERVYHDFPQDFTFDLILEGAVYISAWSIQIGVDPVDLWFNRNGKGSDTIDNVWATLPGDGCPSGQWREFRIAYLYSQQKILVWRDWVEGLEGTPWEYTDSRITGPAKKVWLGLHNYGKGAGYFDLIKVRKYASPEPSVSLGAEEAI